MTREPSEKPTEVAEQALLIDVGNTYTVIGVQVRGELVCRWSFATASARTADEYTALLLPLLGRADLSAEDTQGCLVSSVVPGINPLISSLAVELFGVEAVFVEPGIRTGLPIRHDNPTEVGADRIVNSLAARELYGAPVAVVDFGTATTFDVVGRGGAYEGGIIAPGVGISADALFAQASKLYQVDLCRPDEVIGRSTVAAMQSGIYYGYLGLVDGILKRLKGQVGDLETVVATGGRAALMADGSEHIRVVDESLTLKGLQLIYTKNPRLFRRRSQE